jgi:hypothetical protein
MDSTRVDLRTADGVMDNRPDSPHLLAPNIRARLYIGVAAIDPMFTDEERERLRRARWCA